MKKITLFLLLLCNYGAIAQCINFNQYPSEVVVSNNLGLVQEITVCNYTSEYAAITNLSIGTDYVFTCVRNGVDKFITITDSADEVIASGPSPLTVNAIQVSTIRAHYSEDESCTTQNSCHITTIQALLACSPPTNVATSSIGTTTASFTWNTGGSETQWEVLVQLATEAAPESSQSGTVVTENNYTVINLTLSTQYEFYVRSSCDGDFSPWTLAVPFTTNCENTDFVSENFENTEIGELPACWSKIIRGENVTFSSVGAVDYNSTVSAPVSVRLNQSNANINNSDIILVSPPLSNAGAGTHRVKFFAEGTANIQVGTLDSNSNTGTFTEVQTFELTNNMTEYVVDFSSITNTDNFIAFRLQASFTFEEAFLDNIVWETIPSCPDVIELAAVGISESAAVISWSSQGTETTWQGVISTASNANPNQLTPANFDSTSGTFAGLNADTSYFIWIRSYCAATDLGAWIGPLQVRTDCTPIDAFSENFDSSQSLPACWRGIRRGPTISEFSSIGITTFQPAGSLPNSVELYNSSSATTNGDDIILVSPALSNLSQGSNRIKFRARGSGSIEVGTVDNSLNTAVFNLIESISVTNTSAEFIVNYDSYTGTDRHVAFRMSNPSLFSSVFLDDIIWETIPNCPDVIDLAASATTTTTATVIWTSQGNETNWQYVIGGSTETNPNSLTPVLVSTNEVTIPDLTANTPYRVWIRSYCSANELGAWIGPLNIRTACEAVAEFSEDFDDVTTPALPDCWTRILRGPSISNFANVNTVSFVTGSSEPNTVQLYNDNSTTTENDIILVSPNLSTLASNSYRVKFFAFGQGSVQIVTLDSNTSEANYTVIADVPITSDIPQEFAVNFDTSTTDTYFGFKHNATGIFQSIYIDDVRYEVAPTCPDVTEIVSNGPSTTTTAEITWTPGGSETNWQYAVTTDDNTDPDTVTPSAVLNDTNATIPNLEPGTEYFVYVRSVCPNNDFGAWIGPFEFETQCIPAVYSEEEVEDFEGTTGTELPTCWTAELVSGDNNWEGLTPQFGDITTTHSGTRIAFKNYQTSTAYLYSRPYDFANITEETQLNVWLHRHNLADEADKYNIYVNTVPSIEGAELIFEQFSISSAEPTVPSTGFYNYIAPIPASVNGQSTVYFIIEGITTAGFSSYALGVDDFNVETVLGVDVPTGDTFKMAPNPVTDILQLNASTAMQNVSIYNLLGQELLVKDVNATTAAIDVRNLPAGTYIVKITANGKSQTQKLIKK
ncbi:fibronectin type III domain-containing protein [Flavobacterium sp.]|uniref:fibronectin type III domain-containing protein n=1 Tax=Flavobacterium sp. TaxID=239 RepID=UPI002615FB4E|nr:fibronectin type III domain-containing protein [Flavobacterium sp.]